METLVPAATCHHGRIRVATERATEFIDLTDRIEMMAAEAGIHTGLVNPEPAHHHGDRHQRARVAAARGLRRAARPRGAAGRAVSPR